MYSCVAVVRLELVWPVGGGATVTGRLADVPVMAAVRLGSFTGREEEEPASTGVGLAEGLRTAGKGRKEPYIPYHFPRRKPQMN